MSPTRPFERRIRIFFIFDERFVVFTQRFVSVVVVVNPSTIIYKSMHPRPSPAPVFPTLPFSPTTRSLFPSAVRIIIIIRYFVVGVQSRASSVLF